MTNPGGASAAAWLPPPVVLTHLLVDTLRLKNIDFGHLTMSKRVAIFWPGDYRAKPNEWALPQSREATEQLVAALKKLGRSPYLVEGYLDPPRSKRSPGWARSTTR